MLSKTINKTYKDNKNYNNHINNNNNIDDDSNNEYQNNNKEIDLIVDNLKTNDITRKEFNECNNIFSSNNNIHKISNSNGKLINGPSSVNEASKFHITNKNRNSDNINYINCPICRKLFKNKKTYGLHRKKFHYNSGSNNNNDDNIITCKICAQEFKNKKLYSRHYSKWHVLKIPLNKCNQCNKEFSLLENLKVHNILYHHVDQFNNNNNNNNTAGNSKLIKCPKCDKSFSRLSAFHGHIPKHYEADSFECKKCGEIFKYKQLLMVHKKKVHNKFNKNHLPQSTVIQPVVKNSKINTIHQCQICDETFEEFGSLDRHAIMHKEKHICKICKKNFAQKSSLNLHMSCHNGLRPHVCQICYISFAQRGNLKAHINRYHNDKTAPPEESRYQCKACLCSFDALRQLNTHIRKHHMAEINNETQTQMNKNVFHKTQLMEFENGKKTYSFGLYLKNLNKSAANGVDEKHYDENHTTATNSATEPITGNTTNINASELYADNLPNNEIICSKIRLQLKGNQRKYICVYCTKEFIRPSDALRHLRVHTKEKPYTCDICSKSFAVKHSLNVHMRVHNKRKYVIRKTFRKCCQICSLKFNTIDAFNKHNVMHSKQLKSLFGDDDIESDIEINIEIEKPVELNDENNNCNQDANNNKIDGDNNIVDNDDEKKKRKRNYKYQCEICNKILTHSMQFRKHLVGHTGENPFVCEHCDKKYSTKRLLQKHKKTHLEYKPFKCNFCPAVFVTAFDLKRHGSVHVTKSNYMCPYCKKLFKSAYNCKRHLKIHKMNMLTQLKKDILNGNITINQMENECMDRVSIDDDGAVDNGYVNNIDNIKKFLLKPIDELELKLEPYEYELIKQQIEFEQELFDKKQIEKELIPMEEVGVKVPNESEVTLLNIEELEPYEHELIEQQVEFEQELIEQQKCIKDIIEPEHKNTNQTIKELVPLHKSELVKDQLVPHDDYELIKNKEITVITPQNHGRTHGTIESQDEYLNEAVNEFRPYERELIEQQVELIVQQNCVTNDIEAKQEYFNQNENKKLTSSPPPPPPSHKCELIKDKSKHEHELIKNKELTVVTPQNHRTIESQDEYLNEAVKVFRPYERELIEQQVELIVQQNCVTNEIEAKQEYFDQTIKPPSHKAAHEHDELITNKQIPTETQQNDGIQETIESQDEYLNEAVKALEAYELLEQQLNCTEASSMENKYLQKSSELQFQVPNPVELTENVNDDHMNNTITNRKPINYVIVQLDNEIIKENDLQIENMIRIPTIIDNVVEIEEEVLDELQQKIQQQQQQNNAVLNSYNINNAECLLSSSDKATSYESNDSVENFDENIQQQSQQQNVSLLETVECKNLRKINVNELTNPITLSKSKQFDNNVAHKQIVGLSNGTESIKQIEKKTSVDINESDKSKIRFHSSHNITNANQSAELILNDNRKQKQQEAGTPHQLNPIVRNAQQQPPQERLPAQSENLFSSNVLLNDLPSAETNDIQSSFTDLSKTNMLNVNSLVNYSDKQTPNLSREREYLNENNNLNKSATLLKCENIKNYEEKQSTQTGQLLLKNSIVENQNNCREIKPFTNVTTDKTLSSNSNEPPTAIDRGTQKKKILIEITSDIILQKDDVLYKEIQKDLLNIYGININKITANNNNLSNKSNES